MKKLNELKTHLKPGSVYRRDDLTKWSKSVDRHLNILVKDGSLQKLSQGLYYFPKNTAFGAAPADEESLVRSFLKDDRFLLTSPNAYNGLQVGTTQLYNKRVVYNHKRHGDFNLGNRTFSFRVKPHFPMKLTPEFLIVDLVNNLESLAEDQQAVLMNIAAKAKRMDAKKLARSLADYGSVKTKKLLQPLLASAEIQPHAH
jgi:hypothetical protein